MTTFIPDIDQVTFASAVIATDKKQKLNLYDSARVVWIFETIFKPTHHAFRSDLPTPICADDDLENAIKLHNDAEQKIYKELEQSSQRLDEECLHDAYLHSLIGSRQTLRNTTRGTYYLLPEGVFQNGYLNYDELRNLPLRARLQVLKNSSEVDRFLVEPVSKFSFRLLEEFEDE